MEFIMYVWDDGYFQIDAQTNMVGLSSTPLIEGYADWLLDGGTA